METIKKITGIALVAGASLVIGAISAPIKDATVDKKPVATQLQICNSKECKTVSKDQYERQKNYCASMIDKEGNFTGGWDDFQICIQLANENAKQKKEKFYKGRMKQTKDLIFKAKERLNDNTFDKELTK